MMKLLILAAVVVAAQAVPERRSTPTCISSHDFEYTPNRGGRADSDQMLGAWKEHEYSAHLLCESGKLPDGRVVRVKTELTGGKVGFGTGWQSANPLGVINFKLNEVNGLTLGDNNLKQGKITVSDFTASGMGNQTICGKGTGGSYWQFNKGMSITNSLAGGTKVIGYAFKNDADKAALLNGEQLFSLDGSMLGCKLEIVVEIPVPATGNVKFDVQANIERDTEEAAYRAGMKAKDTGTDIEITTDQKTAAQMRNSTAPVGADDNNVILTMSKSLVCKKNKTSVNASEISITGLGIWDPANGQNTFTYEVKRDTIAMCESLYWDPTMAPFGGYELIVSAGAKTFPGYMALALTSLAVVVLGKQF